MIGIDIVENNRMLNKDTEFIKRILSKKELEIYLTYNEEERKVQYLASRFAAKEAIFKAHKNGNKDLNYNNISILNENDGSPYIEINEIKKENLQISISHEKNYSVAIVIITYK